MRTPAVLASHFESARMIFDRQERTKANLGGLETNPIRKGKKGGAEESV
jgi:hypothetical protein